MEATKKIQNKNRKKRKGNKNREGGNTTIPFERSTLVLLIVFVLHRDYHIIHAYNYVGILTL